MNTTAATTAAIPSPVIELTGSWWHPAQDDPDATSPGYVTWRVIDDAGRPDYATGRVALPADPDINDINDAFAAAQAEADAALGTAREALGIASLPPLTIAEQRVLRRAAEASTARGVAPEFTDRGAPSRLLGRGFVRWDDGRVVITDAGRNAYDLVREYIRAHGES